MKLHSLLIVGLSFSVAGCGEKEQVAPAEQDVTQMTTEALPAAEKADAGTDAFVRHMHAHATQLERLNAALAAQDLDAAQTPAYWLSRHEGVTSPVDEWGPYIGKVRDAAQAVSNATDLESARDAAQDIYEACLGCHVAAGVDIPGLGMDQQ